MHHDMQQSVFGSGKYGERQQQADAEMVNRGDDRRRQIAGISNRPGRARGGE